MLIFFNIDKNKILISSDDIFNCLFFIRNGKIGFFHGDNMMDIYSSGECIGDFSFCIKSQNLNEKYPNGWNYISLASTDIFILSAIHLKRIIENYIQKQYSLYYNIINDYPLLGSFDETTKKIISENIIEVKLKKNDIIQVSDHDPENIFLVKEGIISILSYNNSIVKLIDAGYSNIINYDNIINIELLYINEDNYIIPKRTLKVVSNSAIVYILSRSFLIDLLGIDYINKIFFSCFYYSISKNNEILLVLDNYIEYLDFGKKNTLSSISYISIKEKDNDKLNSKLKFQFDIQPKRMNEKEESNKGKLVTINNHNQSNMIYNYKVNDRQTKLMTIFSKFNIKYLTKDEIYFRDKYTCCIILYGSIYDISNEYNEYNIQVKEKMLLYGKYEILSRINQQNLEIKYLYKVISNICIILEGDLQEILKFEGNSQIKRNLSNDLSTILSNSILLRLFSRSTTEKIKQYIRYITKEVYYKEKSQSMFYILNSIGYVKSGGYSIIEYDNDNNEVSKRSISLGLFGEEEYFKREYVNTNYKDNDYSNCSSLSSYHNINNKIEIVPFDDMQLMIIPYSIIQAYISKYIMEFMKNFYMNKVYHRDNQLNKISLMYFLGKGTYGCVSLIKNIETSQYFALKSISKYKIIRNKSIIDLIRTEKDCLSRFNSPFILKSIATMKDNYFLHFLLEYVKGISLDKLVKSEGLIGRFNETLFIFCNILIILEHLNRSNVLHRDIKPGNLILTTEGYIKVIDFGLSKILNTGFTYTIIGTPYFISPEVLKGNGYGSSCDYWSAGITLYKMYYGKYPFGEEGVSTLDVYKSILNDNLSFPIINSHMNSHESNDNHIKLKLILRVLLSKNIGLRPKSLREVRNLLDNYINLDWDALFEMRLDPPDDLIMRSSSKINPYSLFFTKEMKDSNEMKELYMQPLDENVFKLKGILYRPECLFKYFNEDDISLISSNEESLFDWF